MTGAVEAFTVDIGEPLVADMKRRIRETRWSDDFGNETWQYGVEGSWLREMAAYWADEYDWRETERKINALPNYRIWIDDVPIHFVHAKGVGKTVKPLLLSHGWPWTFWDYRHVIGPLSNPAAHGAADEVAYDLIIPSLPGYGFSEPLRTPGIDTLRVAELWVALMVVLGYDRFGAAGGDWGAIITGQLGQHHPDRLTGVYLTMPRVPGVDPYALRDADFAPDEQWMAERWREASRLTISHVAVQAHDPQTLAYALADSPVGTAAWLWERRRAWSDCDGDVAGLFGREFLCDNASIYWLTNTIGTSFRIYSETYPASWQLKDERLPAIAVPTGFGVFAKDVRMVPRALAEQRTNLKRWSVFEKGGHFAPAEKPAEVIAEYRAFFRDLD
jgi:pimeloyl-ACP methyl ester carboxylesterase